MADSKFIDDKPAPEATPKQAELPADVAALMPPIDITSRDTLAITVDPARNLNIGIGNAGLEAFHRTQTGSGLKIDTGLLSIYSPPGGFKLGSDVTNLHAQSQNYQSNFLGVSVERKLSDNTSVMAYAGQSITDGGKVTGGRFSYRLSEATDIIVDTHQSKHTDNTGAFLSWSKEEGPLSQSFETGVSLRNDKPVVSAAYAAQRKFDLNSGGYLKGQFTVSAAKDKDGTKTSISALAVKDVKTFDVGGVPVTAEVGLGLQKTTGEKVKPVVTWNIALP